MLNYLVKYIKFYSFVQLFKKSLNRVLARKLLSYTRPDLWVNNSYQTCFTTRKLTTYMLNLCGSPRICSAPRSVDIPSEDPS